MVHVRAVRRRGWRLKLVRDCPQARNLPSRRRYALARLVALLAFRRTAQVPAGVDRVVYGIDPDHDPTENYFVGSMYAMLMVAFTAAALPFGRAMSIIVAAVLSPLTLQLPIFIAAVFSRFRKGDFRRWQAAVHLGIIAAFSAYFARTDSAVRYLAWAFLILVAANAIAAVIMFFTRDTVRRMEAECGI